MPIGRGRGWDCFHQLSLIQQGRLQHQLLVGWHSILRRWRRGLQQPLGLWFISLRMKHGLQLSFIWVILLIRIRFPIMWPCWQCRFRVNRCHQSICWYQWWLQWFRWMRSRFFCCNQQFQLHSQLLKQHGLIQHLIIRGRGSLSSLTTSWRYLRVVTCSSFTKRLCPKFSFPMGGLQGPQVGRKLQSVGLKRA